MTLILPIVKYQRPVGGNPSRQYPVEKFPKYSIYRYFLTIGEDVMQKLPKTLLFIVVALSMLLTAFLPAASSVELGYPRNETLYTSGTQWGPPSSWNPLNSGGYAMGTMGLCYETLFIYDPLADKFTPFLAESDKWADDTTYVVTLRKGIKWTNGQPLTVDDVKFTFDIADPNGTTKAGLAYSGLWKFLEKVDVNNTTNEITFKFKTDPAYQEVGFYMWQTPILSKAIFSQLSVADLVGSANLPPVGTGSYKFLDYAQDRMVWVRNDAWWGKDVFGKLPAPKYIVDIVNGSNNVAMGKMLQGGLDLSNNFLPGVASLVTGGYGIKTYYKEAPYMLSANVAALLINETKKPMDDVNFRTALAWMININDIVEKDYTGIVKAADPTGLLPIWDKYIDKDQVKELGWTYDPEKAKKILDDGGYKDVDGDNFRDAPDGSKIALKVTCPSGWTDWMAAIQIISRDAKAVGLNIEPDYPDWAPWRDAQLKGTFDLTLQNEAQMSSTPWSYYKWVFQNPIADIATAQYGNYGRYDNKEAFTLVDDMDKVKVGDDAAIKAIATKLQKITMTEMPTVPLWYNGLWAQYSEAYWTNFPSADGDNHTLPATWRGYWNMSGIQMLLNLEPVAKK
jgi:peptide/nickel transport system substrate-binding protein